MKGGFYWVLKALLSHYWRHPWQTLFLATGLVAGVGLWSAVQIINQNAEDSYRHARNLLGAQASYWIRDRAGEGVEQKDYIALRRAGFRQLFPLLELQVSTADGISVDIIATDLLALPGGLFDGLDRGGDFSETWLDFVQPPYRAWVPEVLAREIGLEQGDRLQLRDGRRLPPALIQSRQRQGRRVLLDIGAALALAGDDRLGYLAVGDTDAARLESLRAALPATLELIENQQHIDLSELTASLHSHLTAMSLLSFAVGLFIVFNAVRFSLWYRRSTLLDLRLMGCPASQLLLAVLVETLLWSLFGAAAGYLLGTLLAQVLLPGLGASLQSLYAAVIEVEPGFAAQTLLKAWSITLLGLAWALAWPLYRQLRQPGLVAAGSDSRRRDETLTRRRLAFASILLALLAWYAYGRVDSVTGGFAVLGMLLFAAAWTMPALLAGGLRLVTLLLPANRFLARWMVSDGWMQLPAFRSAMMALLLALTANLGVGTLVDSFRGAFLGWLELRQSADIYLRAPRFSYDRLVDAPGVESWLADSHRRIGVDTRWGGRPALIRGVDPGAPDSRLLPLSKWQGESAEAARKSWRERPAAVLVNEQVHFLAGVGIGETISLETDRGPKKFEVVGIFYDYGNPYFQFYLPNHLVESHWDHYYSRGVALWLNRENADAMRQAEAAMRALGAQPGDWIGQVQIRRLSVGIFDRTFAITAAMNALTLIVAAIALLASLLAILQERMPQFAQWRALGLRHAELVMLIATPLLIFCAIAWLASIPLGALLSWILIYKINIISFGWSMPLAWELAPALRLAALVLAICAATLLAVSLQWRRRMPGALARLGEAI